MNYDTSYHDFARRRHRLSSVGVALLVATLLAMTFAIGCGPVESTVGISDAEASLTRATVHNAEQYSPYEYERAQHFLYKAKQEWGYSNFETARDYALEARRAADAALDNTHEAPWQGHPVYGFDARPSEIDELEERLEEAEDFEEMERVDDLD